eukprot:TRINITY_DN4515_c0_g1_i1.p1 TRINITY_DN4515_c0_g1~~TRINITY_DN4515_c0_g1_i1.p1  ORF type:complete len:182 (-),score=0.69 TRINITY_DN4515_c0_g1_i1:71-562(-)
MSVSQLQLFTNSSPIYTRPLSQPPLKKPRNFCTFKVSAYFSSKETSGPTDSAQQHFLHIDDFSTQQITQMLEYAQVAKTKFYERDHNFKPLQGRTLAMIFTKPSARTRISFETGFNFLGGHALYLDPNSIQLGKREPTKDIARVISGYNDAIMARLFATKSIQ